MNKAFLALFEGKCISANKIRELYHFPDYKHDKIIAVCMVLIVIAVFNPLMMLAFFITTANLFKLAFLLLLIVFGVLSVLRKKFSLIILGIIATLKLFPFHEAMSDTFIALAIVTFVYLLVRRRSVTD